MWSPQLSYYQKEQSQLTFEEAVFIHLGLFLALPQLKHLKELVVLALDQGIEERKIQEILLQSYLFIGFPRTINALGAVKNLWKTPLEAFEKELDRKTKQQRGEALCQKIYGANYPKLLENMEKLHPDLKIYMIEEGYGKILSRAGLNPLEREMGILPILVLTEVQQQLHSHFLGAYYLGASFAKLEALLEHLKEFLSEQQLTPAFQLLTQLKGRESCFDTH